MDPSSLQYQVQYARTVAYIFYCTAYLYSSTFTVARGGCNYHSEYTPVNNKHPRGPVLQ